MTTAASTQYTETHDGQTEPNTMVFPLTQSGIERAIDDVVEQCAGIRNSTHEGFELGVKQGRALVMAQATQLMSESATDAATGALGRAMVIIFAWVEAAPGRIFNGVTTNFASVILGDNEELEDGSSSYWCGHYDSTRQEALTLLAGWCAEHMAHMPRTVTP